MPSKPNASRSAAAVAATLPLRAALAAASSVFAAALVAGYATTSPESARLLVRIELVSAVALDEDQAGRLTAALASRFECEIELDNEIDAEVIGGAVVYAGDQVIDGSLKGRLGKLANSLAG